MKSGRSSWTQVNAGIVGLDRLVDAAEGEPRQFGPAAGGCSSQAGWLWPETADLASLAVAFGFAAAMPHPEAGRPAGLAVSPGWAHR